MTGHATPEELREIEAREAALDSAVSPIPDLLELALLYIEPSHREEEAIELLETAIARDPVDGEARLWLAYVLLHVRMDRAALKRAREVLAPLLDVDAYAGAANMLLAEVREEEGAGLDERIRLLEASVAREPDWVSNRQDLAWAYSESGRRSEAADQLTRALRSVRPADPTWTVARSNFEESITGRTAARVEERLREDLKELA